MVFLRVMIMEMVLLNRSDYEQETYRQLLDADSYEIGQ